MKRSIAGVVLVGTLTGGALRAAMDHGIIDFQNVRSRGEWHAPVNLDLDAAGDVASQVIDRGMKAIGKKAVNDVVDSGLADLVQGDAHSTATLPSNFSATSLEIPGDIQVSKGNATGYSNSTNP